MKDRNVLKYSFLGLTGTLLIATSLLHASLVPKSQACGNSPNCPNTGSWTVDDYGCNGLCSCSGNNIQYTCYYESGMCNGADPPKPAYYSHCFQYTCTCPSGGGGGGGIGVGCSSDEECGFGYSCDQWGECQRWEQ
jgi:hypothetical protein